MKRLVYVSTCLALVILCTGCGFKKEKASGEAVAANLFTKVQAGDFDGAVTLYSPQFLQKTPPDEWKSTLARLRDKLGSLQSYKLAGWTIRKQAGTSMPGTHCILKYNVTYSNYPAQEVITLVKSKGGTYQIVGHSVNSAGLLKE